MLEPFETILKPVGGVRPFDSLRVGEAVYTLGSPSGLELTLAHGLISGLRRINGANLIQTTAPISRGSSGGGLFDARGNLAGITTWFLSEGQQLNFAIAAQDYW
ncbi:MAG TPA: trypsin-like peptidase domain-containing protein [Geminicoccaceae bacterium]|nr:trypsin-like peptidase domain-containing protein [Geminicoccaceae bacterium]